MKSTKIQVNEMRVRVRGLSREAARSLGEIVAQRLAEARFAVKSSQNIPSVNVRLTSAGNNSIEATANEIVERLRKQLG
jgi:hypothetical protein